VKLSNEPTIEVPPAVVKFSVEKTLSGASGVLNATVAELLPETTAVTSRAMPRMMLFGGSSHTG